MLVDCGLFQGLKELRERNWQPLPVRATDIDAVVLTHAHLDHCGYLPRLVGAGFQGPHLLHAGDRRARARSCSTDAAQLQEEDAERANRKGYTQHTARRCRCSPTEDAARAMSCCSRSATNRPMPVAPGVDRGVPQRRPPARIGLRARARRAVDGKTMLFGGDLGRYGRPVLPDPTPVADADVLLVESTYGDRVHEPDDDGARMAQIINETVERGGKVIIPAFALGRVEELLYWIERLEERAADSRAAGLRGQPDGGDGAGGVSRAR